MKRKLTIKITNMLAACSLAFTMVVTVPGISGLIFSGQTGRQLNRFPAVNAASAFPKTNKPLSELNVGNTIFLPLVMNLWPLPPAPWGITFDYSVDENGGLLEMETAGTEWTRRDLVWSKVEPNIGDRRWNEISSFDADILNAQAHGMEFIAIIESAPSWARKDPLKCSPVKADSFDELANFAYDAVNKYSKPPYDVITWELLNEPDAPSVLGCWGDPGDTSYYGGAHYGEMLKVVYPRMKEANPNIKVYFGGLLLDCDPATPDEIRCGYANFLEGALVVGAGPFFDGVSFHGYDYYDGEVNGIGSYSNQNWNSTQETTGPVLLAKANFIRSVLSKNGVSGKDLIVTENALICGDASGSSSAFCDTPAHETTKAYYLAQSFTMALVEDWKSIIWWSVFGHRFSGLFNQDLSHPQPAYYTYQFMTDKLDSAKYAAPVLTQYENLMAYEFNRNGKTIWVVWAKTNSPTQISLPWLPTGIWQIGTDGKGQVITASQSLTINQAPMVIEY